MSHLLDELLAQAANGSPVTVTFSAESVAVLFFASGFLDVRSNWLDTGEFPLDEVTDADWDEIEKLVAEVYSTLMNPLIGQILPVALATLPPNMLLCDGTTYLKVDYPQLYAALDAAFIVDSTHFKVPDLRGRVPLGAGTGTGLSAYAVGAVGGAEGVTLNASQNGVHTHLLTDPGHTHDQRVGNNLASNRSVGGTGTNQATQTQATTSTTRLTTDVAPTGITVQNSAGGSPHENRQPYLAVKYAMVAY